MICFKYNNLIYNDCFNVIIILHSPTFVLTNLTFQVILDHFKCYYYNFQVLEIFKNIGQIMKNVNYILENKVIL